MNQPYYEKRRSAGFATASIILGTISLACSCFVYLSLPCSALAIMFALLSRGGQMKLDNRGYSGLTLGIIGLTFGVTLYIVMFIFVTVSMGGIDNFLDFYTQYTQQYLQYIQ